MGRPSVGVADWQALAAHWGWSRAESQYSKWCSTAGDQTRISSDRTPTISFRALQHSTASVRSNSDLGTRRRHLGWLDGLVRDTRQLFTPH